MNQFDKTCVRLQNELQRLEGIEQAERELALLQQAHALAIAQQEMARQATADQHNAVALHEQRLQQMHLAQVKLSLASDTVIHSGPSQAGVVVVF